jgi:hypothetical protein
MSVFVRIGFLIFLSEFVYWLISFLFIKKKKKKKKKTKLCAITIQGQDFFFFFWCVGIFSSLLELGYNCWVVGILKSL